MGREDQRQIVPPGTDVLLAVVLMAMGAVLALGNARVLLEVVDGYEPPSTALIVASIAVAAGPVAFRRVYPLGSLLVITGGLLLVAINGVVELTATNVAAFVALVSAGIYGRDSYRDWARGLFAVAIGAILVAMFISRSSLDGITISPRLAVAIAAAELLANVMFVGLGWFLGDLERRRRILADELTTRNSQLESALDRLDEEAATRQRLAIAREVHDVVGHTVSLLGVQAAAARRHLGRDPAAAEAMLRTMEEQSRRTVDEIRSLIDVLRDPGHAEASATVAPTPDLTQLSELVDQVRASGVDVTYTTTGPLPTSSALGLSIYRVVQEALSNAIRHGDGAAEVVLAADCDHIKVFVSNGIPDGNPSAPRPHDRWRTGSGLSGMKERVALHGGNLDAGRSASGRFEVRAVLPLGGAGPADPLPTVDDPSREPDRIAR